MIFKGDLSKYHPADAMTFLSQVGSDGVLNIADAGNIITLTFKSGRLLDAQSRRGDQKLLRCLLLDKRINSSQVRQIQQIERETGLSVRQILVKLDFFPLVDIQDHLILGIDEALLDLFLLDHGSFNFTETPVEDDGAQIKLDPGRIALKVLPASDEYRDFINTIQSLDRVIVVNDTRYPLNEATATQRMVLSHATERPTVRELMDKLPLASHAVFRQIEAFLDKGILSLLPPEKAAPTKAEPVQDPIFSAYKKALKALLSNQEVMPRLSTIVSFCKNFYDNMVILTARHRDVVHCTTIDVSSDEGIVQKVVKGNLGRIDDDPVFATVYRSRTAFFGHCFPCALLDSYLDPQPDSECALIPILIGPKVSVFFYARTARLASGVSYHNYLELLSWIVAPFSYPAEPVLPLDTDGAGEKADVVLEKASKPHDRIADNQKNLEKMVSRIKELPPLPNLVSSALQLLSNPETPVKEVEAVIGQDQALVANLIKVGNSALYGGLQKVTTLQQVLARLGFKITRNLILAASTRSYFLNNKKGMRVWGQSLWQHSVETGLAARRIGETINFSDPEEAFIGGLVHDIGKLIMLMLFPEPFKEILKLKKVQAMDSRSAEMHVFGYDHEQVGRLLMERWNMPEGPKACTEYHHRYHEAGHHRQLAAIVAFADYLSRQYGAKPEALQDADHGYAQDLAAALELSEPAKASLAEAVIDDFQNAELMVD